MFLRALAEEIDSLAGVDERDDMLRGVGRRMAGLYPLPAVQTLDALEIEANDVLESLGWGEVHFQLSEANRTLEIIHIGLPRIGSMGTPAGQWLSALLEGLYNGWMAQQPGNKAVLTTRRTGKSSNEAVVMDYAKR